MTDEHDMQPQGERAPSADIDLTGDTALDERLSQPVLQGNVGIETAQVLAAAFVIVVVAAITYSNTLGSPLISVEREAIGSNEALQNPLNAAAAWTDGPFEPLTAISLALDWFLGGGDPFNFRLTNVILHGLCGVMVFLLARRVTGRHESQLVPALAGIFFVVHPVTTEPVNLLTHRGVLEGVFLMLLGCVLYLRAVEPMERFRGVTYGLALIFIAAGFAAWPPAIVAAVLLPALDFAAHRETPVGRRIAMLAPVWVLSLSLGAAYWMAGRLEGVDVAWELSLSGLGNLAAGYVYPLALSASYPVEPNAVGTYALCGIAIAGLALMWRLPSIGLLLCWFGAALAAGALAVREGGLQSETALYLPLAAIAWVFPMLVRLAPDTRSRTIAGAVVLGLSVVGAGFAYARNTEWREESPIWMDARADCPTCLEPLLRLGDRYISDGENKLRESQALMSQGNANEAARQQEIAASYFRRARNALDELLKLDDVPPKGWVLLGTVQRYQGELPAAEASLNIALKGDPQNFRATLQMAILRENQAAQSGQRADLQQAIELYGRAGELGVLPPDILMRYAGAWHAAGNAERAMQLLQRIPPDEGGPIVANMMANIQERLEARQRVVAQMQRMAQTQPNSPEIVGLAARQLFIQENYLQAAYLIDSFIRNRSPEIELWYLLGVCRAKMNGFNHFLDRWTEAPGTDAGAWRELAKRLAAEQEWNEAREVFLRHPLEEGPAVIEYTLSEIALELGDQQRAAGMLNAAAQARPNDPEPWVRMCELAISVGERMAAQRFIAEAGARGASEAVLDNLRERAGVSDEPTRQIIR